VSSETPEQRTTAQQALRAAHDRDSPLGATRHVDQAVGPDEDQPVDVDFDPFSWKERRHNE
jgi:hypothetical protein